ncbi:MAG: ABC transporter permease subunit [Hoeflea sp.]|uniref:amino acid ABC transporter permease n=1 Tax=Hoeflea sp. TaxID=1940281 RepID=UPI001D93E771|nr:ABC transporter permease subunit [Hoeflea sp.]MBU4530600.1 ABC transporter permease subunit [Alphaproteobacteria bacterium]MBU4545379.1 ABC transporter permease subunit [Alphaproteobacteria bacterium]MBU4552273.1 ABC transporter permease subunit [Alphaproteobacteria bacterium]MBV1721834.1 ABC transporter permease subunit [Hoeflea sp.]MBV1761522.1 ABC transporter permease subunit [Hoeflea sp.]
MADVVSNVTDSGMPSQRPSGTRHPPRRQWPWAALAQQAAAIALVAVAITYLGANITRNLAANGMTGGFGFLWQEAGFAMSFSLIDMSESSTYGRVFLAGVLNTLFIAGLSLVTATILGLIVGFARVSAARPLSLAATVYVEALRNVPMLLILIFVQTVVLRSLPVVREAISIGDAVYVSNRGVYFPWPEAGQDLRLAFGAASAGCLCLAAAWVLRPRTPVLKRRDLAGVFAGMLLGVILLGAAVAQVDWQRPDFQGFDFRGGAKMMPEFAALLLALTLYNAAFIAEIVRAGLQSVDRGQIEAARALGLRDGFIQRRIVLPQALRLMVPPLTNQYVHLIKASSLATVVGFPDLVAVFLGTSLNQTGRAIEIVMMTAAVYLTLCLWLGALSAAWNARVSLKGR